MWLVVVITTPVLTACQTINKFLTDGSGGKGADTVPYLSVLGGAILLCLAANYVIMKRKRRTRFNEIINAVLLVAFFIVVAIGLVLFGMSGQKPEY